MPPKITACILTHGRPRELALCCRSIARSLPPDGEVLVIVNGASPVIARNDGQRIVNDPRFRIHALAGEPRAAARNHAWALARGEIVVFLDDDVVVPRHFFSEVLAAFASDPRAGIAGGPNLTPPPSRWPSRLFGAVMTSAFAAPMVRRRYGACPGGGPTPAGERDLALCNLAVHRDRVPTGLRFEGRLRGSEENVYIHACARRGVGAVFDGRLSVHHWRRPRLLAFLRQIHGYGFGRAQQFVLAPGTFHPAFCLPSLAVALFPVLAIEPNSLAAMCLVHAALSLAGAAASRQARRLGPLSVLLLVPLTALVHAAYGIGFLRGAWHEAARILPRVRIGYETCATR